MDISQHGLDLIKDYESYKGKAYLCPEGVPTIGWGSIRWSANRPVKLGDTCTVDQAEDLLRKEVILVEDAIDSSVHVPLSQGQFDCLCSWGYNVGTGWISGKGHQQAMLIKLLNKGQYDKVPSELLKFKNGAKSGKSYDGLLNRRKRELKELWFADHVFTTPVKTTTEPPETVSSMPQAVAPEKGSLKEAAKSPTNVSAATGLLAAVGAAWQNLGSVASDTTAEVAISKQNLSGFEALWSHIGISLGSVLALVTIGALGVVLVRHVNRYLEGRA